MKKLTLQLTLAAAGLCAALALSKSEPPKAIDCQPPPDATKEPEKIKPPRPVDIIVACPCGCTCGADCRCALAGPCSASCDCGFAWHRYDDSPQDAYLFQGKRQLGVWCDDGYWRPFDAKASKWGAKQRYIPEGVPAPPKRAARTWTVGVGRAASC